jgi:hypothetical protein
MQYTKCKMHKIVKVSRILEKYLIEDLCDIVLQYSEKNLWQMHNTELYHENDCMIYNIGYNVNKKNAKEHSEYDINSTLEVSANDMCVAWSWCINKYDKPKEILDNDYDETYYPLLFLQYDDHVTVYANFQKEYEHVLRNYLEKNYIFPLEIMI